MAVPTYVLHNIADYLADGADIDTVVTLLRDTATRYEQPTRADKTLAPFARLPRVAGDDLFGGA